MIMKNIELNVLNYLKLTVLTLIIFGAGTFTTNVQAQTARIFEIKIPFDFVIKDKTFDAGTYRIGRLSEANPDTLILKNADHKKSSILQTQRLNAGGPLQHSTLSFRRDGETYFLDSIRSSGDSYESRLPIFKLDPRRPISVQLAEIVTITGK